jgi:hypothetical protein
MNFILQRVTTYATLMNSPLYTVFVYWFDMIIGITTITSINSNIRVVFVIETQCVFHEIRTEFLNTVTFWGCFRVTYKTGFWTG